MTKMTYVIAIDNAINGNITDEVREKLEALKVQLAKRNGKERKPTKAQRENENLKGKILDWLTACDEHQTATDVADHFGISNQKASALLTSLVNDRKVVREVVKRKAYFKVG